jgi:APA family basic amino acid/polyamine antiporter
MRNRQYPLPVFLFQYFLILPAEPHSTSMAVAHLERKLGLWSSVSIVIGAVIGSGIFMKPATMAAQVGSPMVLLGVWVGAGIISLFGGMISAELGTMFPKTGGQYVYFRYMYGDFFAFLSGWAGFIVVNTASVAAIAFIFAHYSSYFISLPDFDPATAHSWVLYIPYIGRIYPLENFGEKSLTVLIILIITAVNYVSLSISGKLQVISSVLKVGVLLLMTGLIFFSGKGDTANFSYTPASMALSGWPLITGIVAALSGALAAYDGWNNLGFVAGEIKNPAKNIPKGLVIGIGICILMYVLTSQAYLYMMPIDKMKGSSLLASDALTKAIGSFGGAFIALLVMLSTLGSTNANVLPCARMTFAMSEEKNFFAWAGKVHPRFHTPGNALWLHCILSCLYVFSGSFDMLTDMFVFVTWMFYGFNGLGIILLRRKMPHAERSYRTWGYPLVPIIFMAFSLMYFVITIYNDVNNYASGKAPIINSLFGLLLTLTGVPLYWYLKRKRVASGK